MTKAFTLRALKFLFSDLHLGFFCIGLALRVRVRVRIRHLGIRVRLNEFIIRISRHQPPSWIFLIYSTPKQEQ